MLGSLERRVHAISPAIPVGLKINGSLNMDRNDNWDSLPDKITEQLKLNILEWTVNFNSHTYSLTSKTTMSYSYRRISTEQLLIM